MRDEGEHRFKVRATDLAGIVGVPAQDKVVDG